MRFRTKDYNQPDLGAKRVISKFLWFPIKLEGEYRWLERVKIIQYFRTSLRFDNVYWG